MAYTKDHRLADERQGDLRKKCLELWEVKDGVRRAPLRNNAQSTCSSIVTGSRSNYIIILLCLNY